MDCIFCKIINGEIPADKVYENEQVVAFLDINPVNKGHTLVVPKKHSKNMLEDDLEDLKACMDAVQKTANAAITALNADGFNLGVNTNSAAGQVVMHTHFHMIPRFSDDGLRHWPHKKYAEGEMELVRDKISKAL